MTAPVTPEFAEILTPPALDFVARLHRRFNARRRELLARRRQLQARLDAGYVPDFLPQTRGIRESEWRVVDMPGRPARPPRRDHRARSIGRW